jgi:hypothetical protein
MQSALSLKTFFKLCIQVSDPGDVIDRLKIDFRSVFKNIHPKARPRKKVHFIPKKYIPYDCVIVTIVCL